MDEKDEKTEKEAKRADEKDLVSITSDGDPDAEGQGTVSELEAEDAPTAHALTGSSGLPTGSENPEAIDAMRAQTITPAEDADEDAEGDEAEERREERPEPTQLPATPEDEGAHAEQMPAPAPEPEPEIGGAVDPVTPEPETTKTHEESREAAGDKLRGAAGKKDGAAGKKKK